MIGEADQPTDPVVDDMPPSARAESAAVSKAAVEATGADVAGVGASPKEIGGRDGPDPVRYGDWEKNGRCIDF